MIIHTPQSGPVGTEVSGHIDTQPPGFSLEPRGLGADLPGLFIRRPNAALNDPHVLT